MILQYKDQQVHFIIPETISDIAVSFSGGLDSTLATYLAARIVRSRGQNTTIHTLSGNDNIRPSRAVTLRCREWLENNIDINWGKHYTWDNTRNPDVHKKQIDGKAIYDFCIANQVGFVINGKTSNPPIEVVEMFTSKHFESDRQHDRNVPNISLHKFGLLYRPWVNVDKKFISKMYNDYDIMNLADLTWSCIGYADQTANFTQPCGKCYWCNERKWGFHGI